MVTRVDAGFVIGFDGESHRILRDGVVILDGAVLGLDERVISEELQRIGDHYIDAIPGRNRVRRQQNKYHPRLLKNFIS